MLVHLTSLRHGPAGVDGEGQMDSRGPMWAPCVFSWDKSSLNGTKGDGGRGRWTQSSLLCTSACDLTQTQLLWQLN